MGCAGIGMGSDVASSFSSGDFFGSSGSVVCEKLWWNLICSACSISGSSCCAVVSPVGWITVSSPKLLRRRCLLLFRGAIFLIHHSQYLLHSHYLLICACLVYSDDVFMIHAGLFYDKCWSA
jgi:hypothetical protein